MEDHAVKAKRLRELAARARLKADTIRAPELRATFLQIALSYEDLAATTERRKEHERALALFKSGKPG